MRQRNRRRNPDLEAYRSWQSDRSDRGALQRYLLSMARDREILDDPERIIELDEVVGQDEALRPIYARVRPDYSDAATSFEKRRWRTLVDHYAGRQLDPRAVLILVEMGLRSGVPMGDVYRILHERRFIDDNIYRNVYSLQDEQGWENVRIDCARALGQIGPDAASAIPQLVYSLKNSTNDSVRYYCAWALVKIRPFVESTIYNLIDSLESDRYWNVRAFCASSLGQIGPVAVSAVPQLIRSLQNDINNSVRYHCSEALGQIGPAAASVVPQIRDSLQNDRDGNVRIACRTAIEQITGERPS